MEPIATLIHVSWQRLPHRAIEAPPRSRLRHIAVNARIHRVLLRLHHGADCDPRIISMMISVAGYSGSIMLFVGQLFDKHLTFAIHWCLRECVLPFSIHEEPGDFPELRFAIGKQLSAEDEFDVISIDDAPNRVHLRW